MGKDYGEPIRYDPHFDGPIRNRSCTDVIWLIIFILFLGVWGYVGYYSITTGNVEKLLAPIDSNGNRCGLDSKYENKKYLVFFNISSCLSPTTPITGCRTPQVCVESCPTRTILFQAELSVTPFEQLRPYMVCTDDINKETMTLSDAKNYINNGKCADHVLKSQPVLHRCIGDLSTLPCGDTSKPGSTRSLSEQSNESCKRSHKKDQATLLQSATALDSYVGWIAASWVTFFTTTANERDTYILSSQIVQDLVQSRWYMLGALVVVVIICFLYILLLRWVVAPVVWTSIVGLLALLGFSLYLIYKNYAYYRANPVQLHQTTNLKGYFESIFTKSSTWLVILIIVAILWVILLMIIIFLRSRITIAIALIREGSKAVSAIKSTVFFPIFPWLLQCAVIAYGVVVLMYIISIGDSAFRVVGLKNDTNCDCKGVYTEDYVPCDPLTFTASCFDTSNGIRQCQQAVCHFTGIDNPRSVAYLHLVNLLGFFWTMFFISGTADMMLASTFSTWYWTPKRDLPFFTLTAGIFRTLCYHLGTVAFGSLIIAIVRVIRVILEYIDHKLKKFDNPFTRCLMCCCKCFFWCLENFIKFINKNAYIMCAVHGKNFCTSARDAFSLLMRNIVRVVVLDKVMDFIFFLSKLLISIGVGFAVYYIAQWNYVYEVTNGERLNYSYIPAIILAIATYLISSIFFNVYSMAVDTLFLCFLEDCERNDGTPQKPYAMSTNLMKILGKRNKKAKPE
ncbi:choline transporter-like 2 isoform X2 [Pectinophora gossypiella]|uniref:choline transporter-like 2 isoform X2 n=1 Tax=Pectinophora gossypiella TaxID=13191 RepID=UPI00214E4F9A|nr:choline transporter-like 2 isoform X2 [Pectinophora gossypiella]